MVQVAVLPGCLCPFCLNDLAEDEGNARDLWRNVSSELRRRFSAIYQRMTCYCYSRSSTSTEHQGTYLAYTHGYHRLGG